MKTIIFSLVIILFGYTINAQIYNRIIFKSDVGSDHNPYNLNLPDNVKIVNKKNISPVLNLHLIELSKEVTPSQLIEFKLRNNLSEAWFDAKSSTRAEPNDTNYGEQWALRLTNVDKVWDFTTGGNTTDAKEIVVAVLDDGFDLNHLDLQNVFWSNNLEIPNNNIDDDNNGYVDDYHGLNIDLEGDDHPLLTHGTSVVGIIGANGNNNEGISGVNWEIKILPISGVDRVSEIIEAYSYIYEIRKNYNESNGNQGAYIAVSSYSGGVSNQFGTEGIYKEWCDLYELMGSQGILNFGATDNRYVDVDEVGDMPSTCTSDFFIGITSLSRGGMVDERSAYGKTSIDLAAPGDGILSVKPNNSYGNFEGTSAAAPMASGVAALLFTTPCDDFNNLVNSEPSAAAKIIRKVMIEGVNISEEMSDLYASGGYLDAFRSLKQMNDICDGDLLIESERGALRITQLIQNGDQLTVFFISPNEDEHLLRWVDSGGKTILSKKIIPQRFGEKFAIINVPDALIGPTYLSITSKKHTASKAFFIRD